MQKNSSSSTGILYIVSTPIGNLQDITFRAITTLQSVDLILAEDTRHSGQLLKHLNIEKPMMSLHDHNEKNKTTAIIDLLQQGQSLALISDAGTPLINDPGFILVREARNQGLTVTPIPGCCAVITALSASGLPCDAFSFLGFLPAKSSHRRLMLDKLKQHPQTVVYYESTHRILDCLKDIIEVLGADYQLVLAKELTKTFETFLLSTAYEILDWLMVDANHQKGEFVLIFPPTIKEEDESEMPRVLNILLKELPLKQAVKLTASLTNTNKNLVYAMALKLNLD